MPHIPSIEDADPEALRHRIVPLMRFQNVPGQGLVQSYCLGRDATIGVLYRLQRGDDGRATFVMRRPAERATGLREVARTTILIMMNSNFLPSEAEVLAQLPAAFADVIVAYEVQPDEQQTIEHAVLKSYRRATAVFYAKL